MSNITIIGDYDTIELVPVQGEDDMYALTNTNGYVYMQVGPLELAREWAEQYADYGEDDPDPEIGDGMTDVEADADTLASAGWGTDEDYGYYGDGE